VISKSTISNCFRTGLIPRITFTKRLRFAVPADMHQVLVAPHRHRNIENEAPPTRPDKEEPDHLS
jgi:hypothetical protein